MYMHYVCKSDKCSLYLINMCSYSTLLTHACKHTCTYVLVQCCIQVVVMLYTLGVITYLQYMYSYGNISTPINAKSMFS